MRCLDIWENWENPEWHDDKPSCLLCPQGQGPRPGSPLHHKVEVRGLLTPTQEAPAARRPLEVGKPTDPVFLWVINQGSRHPPVTTKPECTRVALRGVVSASLRPWLINCHLSHLSRVGCGVLGHLHNQGRQHTAPCNHGVERR